MVNEYLISALIMLLGNVVATIVPYLRKQRQASLKGGSISFNLIYLYNAIAAAVVQFIFALPVVAVIGTVGGATETLGLVIMSFAYGYGGNKAQIEGAKVFNLWNSLRKTSSIESKTS